MGRLCSLTFALFAPLALMAQGWLSQLPAHGTRLDGYDTRQEVCRRMERLPLAPAEGLWQMAQSGAVFALERADADPTETFPRRMRLVVVSSPVRRILPGTLMGHAVPTVKPDVYEARLFTDIAEAGRLAAPRTFLLRLNDQGNALTIEPVKRPFRVNLLRLLPYMYRSVVTPQQSRPDDLDGALRLYPADRVPIVPVYL